MSMLVDPWQFDDRHGILVLLEYLNGRIAAGGSGVTSHPVARNTCIERMLEGESRFKRVLKLANIGVFHELLGALRQTSPRRRQQRRVLAGKPLRRSAPVRPGRLRPSGPAPVDNTRP
jgi:hypothetical protein